MVDGVRGTKINGSRRIETREFLGGIKLHRLILRCRVIDLLVERTHRNGVLGVSNIVSLREGVAEP